MAPKVTTHVVYDLTGDAVEEGNGETVQFSLDGTQYQIDVTHDNARQFRVALSDHIAPDHKISGRSGPGRAVWLLWITPSHVRLPADQYAEALLGPADEAGATTESHPSFG